MKKLLSSLMLSWCAIAPCMSQNFSSGGINYEVLSEENHTVMAVGATSEAPTDLTIPATVTNEGINYSVEAIGEWSFLENTNFTSLTIEDGVARIGDGAFYYCTSISSLNLPSSLQYIGRSAFSYCFNLATLTIPDKVTTLCEDVFGNCSSLRTVVLGKNIEGIPENCFYGCTKLKTVKFSDNVASIATNAFYECTSLESLALPSSLTEIKPNAFFRCSSLKTLTVSASNPLLKSVDGVIYSKDGQTLVVVPPATSGNFSVPYGTLVISPNAFCTSAIESVQLSSSVEEIGECAFMNCATLKEITVGQNWEGSNLLTVGRQAFAFCPSLETISLYSKNIERFGSAPFDYSSNIVNIYIYTCVPPTIEQYNFGIGGNGKNTTLWVPQASIEAYENANGWKNFNIVGDPAQPIVFENSIFSFTVNSEENQTVSLTGLNLDDRTILEIPSTAKYNDKDYTVSEIGLLLLMSNKTIKEVIVPGSVKKIDDGAFCDSNLERITLNEGLDTIGSTVFSYSGIENVVLPSTVRYIAGSAFAECANLKSIVLSEQLDTIKSCTFYDCTSLESVTFGNSLKSIEAAAFYQNISLKNIELPEGLETLNDNPFFGCQSLETVYLPSTIEKVTGIAFANCPSLKNIIVSERCKSYKDIEGVLYTSDGSEIVRYPSARSAEYTVLEGVETIGMHAFSYSRDLKDITLPSTLTSIEEFAFYGCSEIPSITLPEGILYIFDAAFQNCSNLTELRYPNSLLEIGYWGLANNPSLKRIYIGPELIFICPYFLEGSANVEEIHISAVTPPTAYGFYFTTNYYSSINLYVPEESVADYEITSPWNNCNVIGENTNLVEWQIINADAENDEIYTIDGRKVSNTTNLPKGIYIRNGKKIKM